MSDMLGVRIMITKYCYQNMPYIIIRYRELLSPGCRLDTSLTADSDEVIGADIFYNNNGERHEMEIERIDDISEIVKQIVG